MGKSSSKELGGSARWLLNIAYMTLGEYPQAVPEKYLIPTTYFQSEVEFPQFKNVAEQPGLDTYNHAASFVVAILTTMTFLTSSPRRRTQRRKRVFFATTETVRLPTEPKRPV